LISSFSLPSWPSSALLALHLRSPPHRQAMPSSLSVCWCFRPHSRFVFDAGGPCSVEVILGTWLGLLSSPSPSARHLVAPLSAFPACGRRGSSFATAICAFSHSRRCPVGRLVVIVVAGDWGRWGAELAFMAASTWVPGILLGSQHSGVDKVGWGCLPSLPPPRFCRCCPWDAGMSWQVAGWVLTCNLSLSPFPRFRGRVRGRWPLRIRLLGAFTCRGWSVGC